MVGKIDWMNSVKMSRVSPEVRLQRAEGAFLKGDYSHALRSYGLILKDYPSLDEARIGVYLSDLGVESEAEAQALFDYYQVIKREKKNAVEIIDNLITSLDTTKHQIEELLSHSVQEQVEYGDGIRYSDFLALVESRGSFKQTFEDIMFSTKVIITEKDEFIDFVKQLAKEGFNEMALGYLDGMAKHFGNDQDVLALYSLMEDTE